MRRLRSMMAVAGLWGVGIGCTSLSDLTGGAGTGDATRFADAAEGIDATTATDATTDPAQDAPNGEGGPRDAGARDETVSDDASSLDVRDATPDAADASDASGDVSDASPGATWCMQWQPSALLCADFDEGSLTSAYHSGTLILIPSPTVNPGGNASVGSNARSAPGAFAASVGSVAGGNTVRVRFDEPFSVSVAQAEELQFDLRLVSLTVGEEIDFATLYLPSPDGGAPVRAFLSILPSGEGQVDVDQGGPGVSETFPFPGDGNWHTFSFQIVLEPMVTARVYVDDPDASHLPATQVTQPAAFATSPQATFVLGVSDYGPASPVQVAIDNVVFSAQ